jgi:hypothetical protein
MQWAGVFGYFVLVLRIIDLRAGGDGVGSALNNNWSFSLLLSI